MMNLERLITCLLIGLYAQGGASDSVFKFVGIGYNLLTGNPDGGPLESGGVDPGLLYTRKILDLSHPMSVEAEVRQSCTEELVTSTFFGTKSYQDKLSVGVDLSGGAIAGIANFAFSLSPRFDKAREQTMTDHKVFQDEQVTCNLGRQRFADELTHAYSFPVTENFAAAVCSLPAEYDSTPYMQFLDSWGTHMTMQVDIGTKNITRRESTLSEFVDHVTQTSGVDISAGGTYMGYGGSLKVNFENYKASSNYDLNFGELTENLLTGTAALPEPIGLKLVPIDTALSSVYWQNTSSWISLNLCTTSQRNAVPNIQNNLRTALSGYAAYKMAHAPTDQELQIPLMWPRGTYGLYKAATGCPGLNVTWLEGWRVDDSEDSFTDNEFSDSLHLAGTFHKTGDVQTEFCIKGISQSSDFDISWPRGDYCIAKYGDCPSGFMEGWLKWDDEDFHNDDKSGGYLPDGNYGSDTTIDYCCRSDNVPSEPINLPTDKPFYLLRHTRSCQVVNGMQVMDEFVYWDEEFWQRLNRHDKAGGASPYDDGNNHNHKIHFCYYLAPDDSVIVG